jgi:hypothetical protein
MTTLNGKETAWTTIPKWYRYEKKECEKSQLSKQRHFGTGHVGTHGKGGHK